VSALNVATQEVTFPSEITTSHLGIVEYLAALEMQRDFHAAIAQNTHPYTPRAKELCLRNALLMALQSSMSIVVEKSPGMDLGS
jgi:hypothetical protein